MSDEEDEKAMRHMFTIAKGNHEKTGGRLMPVAFVLGADRSMVVLSLGDVWANGNERDVAAEVIKREAAKARATMIAIVSDTWRTMFKNIDKIKAAGLDLHNYREWPEEALREFPPDRREAIMMNIESRLGHKILLQFYRRDDDRVIWEEFQDMSDWAISFEGRFSGLLPRTGVQS